MNAKEAKDSRHCPNCSKVRRIYRRSKNWRLYCEYCDQNWSFPRTGVTKREY